MPHPSEHSSADRPLGRDEAHELAASMAVFGTASRLQILYALIDGERHVDDLAATIGLASNTISQQLRILRSAHVVRVRREGRRAYYALHDAHVVDLLAAIRHHAEHAQFDWSGPGTTPAPSPAEAL